MAPANTSSAGDTTNSLYNLSVRIFQRILEVPFRGLPKGQSCVEPFDEARGVKTSGVVWLTNMRERHFTHGIRYEPCFPARCNWAIRNAAIETGEFTFVDVGCGKGRPLIIASDYKFGGLVGVDYSRKLCEIARRNLQKLCVEAQITCQDAATFQFPDKDVFAYLYHPFDAFVLRKVVAHLPSHRRVVLAYDGPRGEAITEFSWLKLYAQTKDLRVFRNF